MCVLCGVGWRRSNQAAGEREKTREREQSGGKKRPLSSSVTVFCVFVFLCSCVFVVMPTLFVSVLVSAISCVFSEKHISRHLEAGLSQSLCSRQFLNATLSTGLANVASALQLTGQAVPELDLKLDPELDLQTLA